jgi:hypothetical protein
MTSMPAMSTVHEEMATYHESEETLVRHSAGRYFKEKDRRQGYNQTHAEKPDDTWDAHRAISNRGMRFHFYSFESNLLSGLVYRVCNWSTRCV